MAASPSPRRGAARTRAGASSGTTTTLADFRTTVGTLTPAQRATVVRQAMAMIDGLYVHLPLKRAMRRAGAAPPPAAAFLGCPGGDSDELMTSSPTCTTCHTNYVLPAPFADRTAVLPFLVEEYVDKGKVRTSSRDAGPDGSRFAPG
jgi:hypothetical protein